MDALELEGVLVWALGRNQVSISLSHLGEVIVAAMANERRQEFLDAIGLSTMADASYVSKTAQFALPEMKLSGHDGFIFDGASRVDVAFRLRSDLAIGAEVKLGNTLLSKSTIDTEFLENCRTSHGGKRLAGNMMAILERRFSTHARVDGLSVEFPDGAVPLCRDWLIIAKTKTLQSWEGDGRPAFSEHVRCIDIARLVDAYGGKEAFNRLVRRLLEIDFFHEWLEDA